MEDDFKTKRNLDVTKVRVNEKLEVTNGHSDTLESPGGSGPLKISMSNLPTKKTPGFFRMPDLQGLMYFAPLMPYVTLEEEKEYQGQVYNDLAICFKLDHKDQKVEVVEQIPAVFPNTVRVIIIRVTDPEGHGGHSHDVHSDESHFYHTKIRIYKTEMEKYENKIYVRVDHPEARHGGSGSTHYPSD